MRVRTFLVVFVAVFAAACGGRSSIASSVQTPSVAGPQVKQGGGLPLNWTRFSPNTYSTQYGAIVAGPGKAMWFTDFGGNGLVKLGMDGSVTEFPLPTHFGDIGPLAIAATSDGKLFVLDCAGHLELVKTNGKLVFDITPPGTNMCVEAEGEMNGLAVDSSGDAWIPYAEGVTRVTESGNASEYLYPNGLNNVGSGITLGDDGRIYFLLKSDDGSHIGVVDPRTLTLGAYDLPFTCDFGRQAIVSAKGGNLWFGCNTSTYGKVQTNGNGATKFSSPVQLINTTFQAAVGPGGFPFFLATDGATIGLGSVNTNTGVLTYLPSHYTGAMTAVSSGPDGNVWITTADGHVDVFIKDVLTVKPTSLNFPGAEDQATITGKETGHPNLTANSSNVGIATVAAGPQSNTFIVTSIGVGSCTVTVQDNKGNSFDVAVTVQ